VYQYKHLNSFQFIENNIKGFATILIIMLNHIVIFSLLSSASGFFMNFPGYITFDTDYYNTTNCNNSLNNYHSSNYESVCFDDISKCCNIVLQDLNFMSIPNRQLDTCYTENVDNNTVSYLYHCQETNLNKNQSLLVKFSMIGFIFLFISCVSLITVFFWWCCRRPQRNYGYGMIN
jgi:hypothetical protein